MPVLPLKIGDKIGCYEILEELGTGQTGTVYRARDNLNRDVALKVLHMDLLESGEAVKRFEHEAEAAASVTHEFIVKVHYAGKENGLLYIAYQFIEGPTLRSVMTSQSISYRRAAEIIKDLASAAHCLHKNRSNDPLTHRDIKPENIFLDDHGKPHLGDLGLALRTYAPRPTKLCPIQGRRAWGTPGYMAPEQEAGNPEPRSDQYSLGAVFYELLTGKLPALPFLDQDIVQGSLSAKSLRLPLQKAGVPEEVQDICLRALENEPVKRFADCHELETALSNVLYRLAVQPPPCPTSGSTKHFTAEKLTDLKTGVTKRDIALRHTTYPRQGKKSIRAALFAFGLMLLAFIVVVNLVFWPQQSSETDESRSALELSGKLQISVPGQSVKQQSFTGKLGQTQKSSPKKSNKPTSQVIGKDGLINPNAVVKPGSGNLIIVGKPGPGVADVAALSKPAQEQLVKLDRMHPDGTAKLGSIDEVVAIAKLLKAAGVAKSKAFEVDQSDPNPLSNPKALGKQIFFGRGKNPPYSPEVFLIGGYDSKERHIERGTKTEPAAGFVSNDGAMTLTLVMRGGPGSGFMLVASGIDLAWLSVVFIADGQKEVVKVPGRLDKGTYLPYTGFAFDGQGSEGVYVLTIARPKKKQ